ncbi:MAG: ABC transporter ATP-binding protein [Nitriliruptorales bacterium]|nr:ABC transporter ATP-binding protein [Nitriliruptorales bacterium]
MTAAATTGRAPGSASATATPILELSNVTSGYGDLQVLHGLTLHVNPGEVVALMGTNGAGKTTTLRTIVGLLPVTGGSIRYDGEDISHTSPERLVPKGLVLCPEGRGMLKDLTVRQNLELGAYVVEDRSTIGDRLDQAFEAYPILRERQRQLAGTLSGGQQQMLAVVRAMMSGPRLLLIDEASLGLSPIITEDTFELIGRLNREQQTAILIVEQNVQALDLAHRAYVLEKGVIVQEAVGDELEDLTVRLREVYLGGGH